MMKKTFILLLIVVFVSLPSGCRRNTVSVTLIDSITGLPISSSVMANGKQYNVSNGELTLEAGDVNLSVPGYMEMRTTLLKDGKQTIKLTPQSWILLTSNVQNPQIELDGKTFDRPYTENGYKYAISPVGQGDHSLVIRKQYFKDLRIVLSVRGGENTISAYLEPDSQAVDELISSLLFPSKESKYSFAIELSGSLNSNSINKKLRGEVVNGSIVTVNDNDLEYKFELNKVLLNGKEVKEEETAFALLFAKATIEDFLNFRDVTKGLKLKDITNGFVTFGGVRNFEDRPFNEDVSFVLSDHKVNRVIVSIDSQEMNTKLLVEVEMVEE